MRNFNLPPPPTLQKGKSFSYATYYMNIISKYCNKPISEIRVLDYGCGTGWLTMELQQLGYQVFGFDFASRLNDSAFSDKYTFSSILIPSEKTLTLGTHSFFDNTQMDWDNFFLPYEDNSFDVIITSQVIEHLFNLRSAVSEFNRILKHDGVTINTFPTKQRIVEAHLRIPFAQHIQWKPYWTLMSYLGFGNPSRLDCPLSDWLDEYRALFDNVTIYRSTSEIVKTFSDYFTYVVIDNESYSRTIFRNKIHAMYINLKCNFFKSIMLVAQHKKQG